jgi:hypothetical protein
MPKQQPNGTPGKKPPAPSVKVRGGRLPRNLDPSMRLRQIVPSPLRCGLGGNRIRVAFEKSV